MKKEDIILFAMPNSIKLGQEVSQKINIPLNEVLITKYADGETLLKSDQTVRNKEVFIFCSTSFPINENIMQLLIFIDSLKRATAKNINVIMTYYGYARQDRKTKGREPITAKLVASLLEKSGVNKVISVDLHNPSIQGFFDIPVDDLRGQYIIAEYINKKINKDNLMIVSPDHGGAVRSRLLADILGVNNEIAIVDKSRAHDGPNQSTIHGILGNVKDRDLILVDDMVDTGGTIINAVKELKKQGAKKIVIVATHGIFSKGFDKFDNEKDVEQVIVTNSISSVNEIKSDKLVVVSLAEMIAKVIEATFNNSSIAKIYEEMRERVRDDRKN